jgi:c(7)-type cytochrome triheme protein
MVRTVRSFVGLGLTLVIAGGCSTVASVLLDAPKQSSTPREPSEAGQAGAPGGSAPAERAPLPIELTADRDSILELLPLDEAGAVDWVAAIRQGTVDPLWSPSGDPGSAKQAGFGFDFSLKGPNEMFDAAFPHSAHVQWVACQSCHDEIFPYKGDPITMEAVNAGEACGRCHEGMPAFEPVTDPLGKDVVLAREGADENVEAAFPRARFPHWRHRIRYRCTACHPSLFAMRAGTDTLTMAAMGDGAACGACHDGEVAFDLVDCTKCHTASAEQPADGA